MKRKADEKDASLATSSAKRPRYEVTEDAIASSPEKSHGEEPLPVTSSRSSKAGQKQTKTTPNKIQKPSVVKSVVNGIDDAVIKVNRAVENGSLESTPSKKTAGRPKGPNWTPSKPKMAAISTPSRGTNGKKMVSTPLKTSTLAQEEATPTIPRHADRSARRKSTRNLIERTLGGNESDVEEEEDELARDIYGDDAIDDAIEEEDEEEDGVVMVEGEADPSTPSKRAQKKGKSTSARKRSPTPPADLPPHELFFLQNRPGRQKTSDNTFSSVAPLDHEEYFSILRDFKDSHAEDIQYLQSLHSNSFNQWQFELSQGFSICIYGWGSKRGLLTKFAEHIYNSQSPDEHEDHKIVIVNGYTPTTTFKDIFQNVTTAVLGASHNLKLGSLPNEMLESLISVLTAAASSNPDFHLTLIINSIDAPPLRRLVIQNLLSRLASHPQVSLIASADHPSFPVLWDSSLRSNYNFLFHDSTTFQPFEAEIDVIDSVHDLLGRSGRRVGGKEGVSFVLKSLPENAKKLFGVLVAEQLAGMDGGADNNDEVDGEDDSRTRRANARNQNQEAGVELRVLYQKAVEEFICSAEMGFRNLLKEFIDHQMIEIRKDAMGTEILCVPFRKEELETILEDLMS